MKVLFVLQSIGYGGSMTSLINLLTLLRGRSDIECDALFMDPYGELLEDARKVVNVCSRDVVLESATMSRSKMLDLKLYGDYLCRLGLVFLGKLKHKSGTAIGFDFAAKRYDDQYDCVVAYQESVATNFAIRIRAKKHVAWIHNDYENVLKIHHDDREALRKVYACYDDIVCVSKAGADNFRNYSGVASDKITCIYNTLLPDVLMRKSAASLQSILDATHQREVADALATDGIRLVSSGRFATQKRFDRVVEAACILKERQYHFKWFILGAGELVDEITTSIRESGLSGDVILTGGLKNPFPMIKACDVFVLTSEFEANPMVANEALILGKPVISTNFESAHEVIADGQNGLICAMGSNQIAEAIISLLDNAQLFEQVKAGAANFNYTNDVIIHQVIQILT